MERRCAARLAHLAFEARSAQFEWRFACDVGEAGRGGHKMRRPIQRVMGILRAGEIERDEWCRRVQRERTDARTAAF